MKHFSLRPLTIGDLSAIKAAMATGEIQRYVSAGSHPFSAEDAARVIQNPEVQRLRFFVFGEQNLMCSSRHSLFEREI